MHWCQFRIDSSQYDLCFRIHSFNEKTGLEGDESIRMGGGGKKVGKV